VGGAGTGTDAGSGSLTILSLKVSGNSQGEDRGCRGHSRIIIQISGTAYIGLTQI
jgi:hypothetical protein